MVSVDERRELNWFTWAVSVAIEARLEQEMDMVVLTRMQL